MSMPAEPITVDDGTDDVERILVVTAHPDDVDFGAAGSVATWTGRGIEVSYCIATDGDAGGSDHSISRAEMAAIRREEQLAAARAVGVTDVTFLGFADGRVTPTARAAVSCSSRRMAAISGRLIEWSEPPASPSVAMQ